METAGARNKYLKLRENTDTLIRSEGFISLLVENQEQLINSKSLCVTFASLMKNYELKICLDV